MTVDLETRLASLPPEKRRLLELRLKKEGIAAERKPAGPPAVPRRDPADPGPFPLTFGQQRLWFIEQLNPGTAAYNIPFAGRLRGRLDPGLLERSLREVVRRHEVLRSRFLLQDGRPVQVVDPEPFVRLPLIDLTALPAEDRETENARLILAEPHAPFDLERGPVLRVSLVKVTGEPRFLTPDPSPIAHPSPGRGAPPPSAVSSPLSRSGGSAMGEGGKGGEDQRPHVGTLRSQLPGMTATPTSDAADEHVLLVTMPHLITDAWSMGIFFRELPVIYEGFRHGRSVSLPPLPIQVADYALWQRAWLQGEVLEEQLRFWREYLRGAPPVLALPTDRPRPATQTFHGKRLPMALPPDVIRGLKPFNERHGVTSFMTLLAVLDVLLQRWSGLDDVVVGSPVVTRPQPETHPLIGFFINTAVLRTRMEGDPTFAELLLRVRDSTLASLAHQDFPFERLTEAMEVARDLSYPPLVQVSFVLQNVHIPQPDFEDVRLVDSWQTDTGTARFDLGVGVFEEEGEDTIPQGGFDYNTDLFDEATILRMRGHFLALAASALAEPGRRLSELPMLSELERRQLLAWSAITAPLASKPFLEVIASFAKAPALVGEEGVLTYSDLLHRTEDLAARLQAVGVGPEIGVAVCLERSPERVIAFLGALASGGFYLPLDPAWPAERLRFQIRDSNARVVVTTRELAERFGFEKVVLLDEPGERHALKPAPSLPDSLAYVFYTSGSTGRPKGVMVSRRSLDRLAESVPGALGDAPGERVLQTAAPGFDAWIFEIVTALAAGRALVVPGPDVLLAGPDLAAVAEAQGVTCGILTPTALASVPEGTMPGVRSMTLGGEAAPLELVRRWSPGRRLFNVYGPTEGTVTATIGEVEPLDTLANPPIGRPIAGVSVYVLDARLQLVPAGVHGELCIGGSGVARGYLGRPDLTAASFAPDPFSTTPGARMYRTGDKVRHLPDGRLDFLGRLDQQVKVRGVRIEPGEIEAVLKEHPAVRDSAVVLREDGRLMACIVAHGQAGPGELREALRARLPEAMVPAVFAFVDELPRTGTGKLDRAALARLEPEAPRSAFEAPAGDRERALAAIWTRALKVDQIGRHDDFFDLGGDSILAIQVVARAAEAGVYLEPRHLFEHPTIAGLAAVAAGAPRIDAEQGPITGPVPLTPIQRWFLEDLDPPAPHHWNLSLMLEAEPENTALDPVRLHAAVARLVEHHDLLRARFLRTGAGWRQEIAAPSGEAPFMWMDLSALPDSSQALARASAAVQAAFRLDAGPLLRAAHFDLGPAGQRLLLAAHHLVVDAVSWPILLADLRAAYDGIALPPKTTSFQRWAERLKEWSRSSELRQELDFWRGAEGPQRLPAPSIEGAADRVEVRLDAETTRQLLSEVPDAWPIRTEEVLLTAVAEALAEWRGERTVAIAIEGHGRERLFEDADLSRTVGWFTTSFPLSLDLGESGPGEALKAVKERLRRVPRRGLGYGVLRHLAEEETLRHQPRPEVSFNYLGRADAAADGPFRLVPDAGGAASDPRNPRPHPLAIDAFVLAGELHLVFTYDRERLRRATIERLGEASLLRLRALIAHCLRGEEGGHTTVDFPHAGLEQDQLERLLGKIGRGR